MHVPVEVQVWRVGVLVLLGIGTDLVFHVYRAYRSVFPPRSLWYHLLDALVALMTIGAVGVAVFVVNWGEVRLYVSLSLAGGFLIANMLIGDLAYRWARRAFQQVKRGMRWARVRLVEPPKRAVRQALEWTKARLILPPEPSPPEEPPAEPPTEPPPDPPGQPPE